MEFLYVVVLTIIAYLVLFILAKIMGYRELSELSFLDYTVGITIGSIGAELATNVDKSWWRGLVAMLVFALVEVFFAFLSRKNMKLRKFMTGNPIIIMSGGEIDRKAMKKAQIDVNDLLTQAREQGYFDLSDIDYAIMEINGRISFLPVTQQKPVVAKDLDIKPQHTGLCTTLIVDGEIMEDNLVYAKVTPKQLDEILEKKKVKPQEVLLLTYDETGEVQVFKK